MAESAESTVGPRRSRWPLLVALALAVAVAAVATVVSISLKSSPTPPVAMPQKSAPFPVKAPPSDRPLLWFGVPVEPPTAVLLRAFDWHGEEVGSVAIPCPAPCGVQASPDGHRLLVGVLSRDRRFKPDWIYDATGRQIGSIYGLGGHWADDSEHLCIVGSVDPGLATPAQSRAQLSLVDASSGSRHVVAIISAPAVPAGGGDWLLRGCSIANDRAVLTFEAGDVRAVRVVKLSTGQTIVTRDYGAGGVSCACQVADIAVSADATVAVETLVQGRATRRLDLRSGVTSAAPTGPGVVFGLSWDGRLALTELGVVDAVTGRIVWQTPSPSYNVMVAAEPAGNGLLVDVWFSATRAPKTIIIHEGRGWSGDLPPELVAAPALS